MTTTNRHYEQPPEAFAAFLGRRMKYTCGLYGPGVGSLDEAQEAKLRMIASLLGVRGGERVLDIGCGWGALALFLAQEYDCHVTAVTPSAEQQRFVARRALETGVADRVRVVPGTFETAGLDGPRFDAAAMVGVLEHLPEHREPLRKVHRLLRKDASFYLSASCYRSRAARLEYERRPRSLHAVELYGFTAMNALSQLVEEVEDAGFSLTALTDLTAHYDRTMRDWQQRIAAGRAAMDAAAPGFADGIGHYFEAARASWGYTAKHYALAATRSRLGATRVPRSGDVLESGDVPGSAEVPAEDGDRASDTRLTGI
ncbi:class I SAM-dependent methyltransferase [Streptomyces pathocidini]|uniref:SAM-dependent methyltransferase n=1 Tax=Streptomyces pathocidini TaxID=1650571 RepID=UPI0033CA8BD4